MSVAETITPLLNALVGEDSRVRIEFWDGSSLGPERGDTGSPGTLRVLAPDAVRRILWSPNELGLARAYVAGELEADGDIFALLEALRGDAPRGLRFGVSAAPLAVTAARRLDLVGRPPAPPPEEARLHGWRHSRRRDADAIGHHYDVSNEFYRLVLGPSMTYSCARFSADGMDLTEAQASKHELICRKLGLPERPGARLLDVGCGWGSMVIHAALHYDVTAVGITISRSQADLARKRAAEAGVGERVEIRLQDYRELTGEQFDVISSIGMSEHVGAKNLVQYYTILHDALRPQGRLLNHAISSVGGSRMGRTSFIGRYVFPDGELIDVAASVKAMEEARFEIRDVESLREHYARTLRAWVANLETNWDEAVRLVGARRARVWRLYMAGSAVGFADGGINVHQVLGVVPTPAGASGMPATRHGWNTA
jgi:cyclopropane-fatty-acyl-phospholipid synthase